MRTWLIGLLVVWFFISLLMLVGLDMDHYGAQRVRPYFVPTHLILALFAGCGLMLIAAIIGRPIAAKSDWMARRHRSSPCGD